MDTTNKHIGNVLSKMSDEDLREVLEQYLDKSNFENNIVMLKYFETLLKCETFDCQ